MHGNTQKETLDQSAVNIRPDQREKSSIFIMLREIQPTAAEPGQAPTGIQNFVCWGPKDDKKQ